MDIINFTDSREEIIKKLKENKKTIFIISHDLNYLKSNCDNILYFNKIDNSTNINLFIKDDFIKI